MGALRKKYKFSIVVAVNYLMNWTFISLIRDLDIFMRPGNIYKAMLKMRHGQFSV